MRHLAERTTCNNYEDYKVRSENITSYTRTELEDDTDTMKADELTFTDNEYCSNALLAHTGRQSS